MRPGENLPSTDRRGRRNLQIADDNREQSVEVVSDATCKLTNGVHFLRLERPLS